LAIFIVCWIAGGTLIWVGVFNLLGRPLLGAIVGSSVQLGILIVFFLLYATAGPVIG
jgi:hypothetical protein